MVSLFSLFQSDLIRWLEIGWNKSTGNKTPRLNRKWHAWECLNIGEARTTIEFDVVSKCRTGSVWWIYRHAGELCYPDRLPQGLLAVGQRRSVYKWTAQKVNSQIGETQCKCIHFLPRARNWQISDGRKEHGAQASAARVARGDNFEQFQLTWEITRLSAGIEKNQ